MPFDQLFSGKVDTSSGATTAPAATSGATAPAMTGAGQDQTAGQDQGFVANYVPPVVQNVAAGVAQGAVRDPAQTIVGNSWVAPVVNWVDRNVPVLGALDRWAGTTPENIAGQTQAYEKQYGDSDAAAIGRLGGNVLAGAAIPGSEAVGGLAGAGRLGNALAPVLRGAYAGGTGAALTAGGYGENPLVAGAEGALGGAVIGPIAAKLGGGGGNADLQGLADRLGIKLTGGQSQGGALQMIEDVSKHLPFSGAASTDAAQKADIVNVLERNMGVAKPTGHLDLPEVGAAKTAAGSDMGRIANGITIDGGATAGPATAGGAAPNLVDRLNQIVADHSSLGTDQLDYRAAVNLRNAVYSSITNGGGTMPGTDLARLISNNGTLSRFADHSDSAVRDVAAEVRSALFNAADNTPSNPAGIMKDFRDAQLRYKASATAADAIGPTGSTEQMTPQGLKQAINRHYSDQMVDPRATGPGYDMPDLSRLIRGIPKLASSGTAERLSLMNLLGIGGAGVGGGVLTGTLSNPLALSLAAHAALPFAAVSAAGAASRKLPVAQIARALPNQLLPRVAGQGVGRVISGNQLSPSP